MPLATAAQHATALKWLALGSLLVTAIGVVDDVWSVRPSVKLAVQALAAAIALAAGYGFDVITNPFTGGYIELGGFGVAATLLWIIAITNGFNLIDGLDGLAAGVALIASATVFTITLVQSRPDAAVVSVVLAGAVAGFLPYNFYPASIFLGDCGALMLGYVLSVLSIQGQQKGPTAVVLLMPLLALGLPIIDTLLAVWRRFAAAGAPAIFAADSEHIHHRLLGLGLHHRDAVLLLYGVCSVFGLLAIVAVTVAGPGSALLVVAVASAAYVGIRTLGYTSASTRGVGDDPDSRPAAHG